MAATRARVSDEFAANAGGATSRLRGIAARGGSLKDGYVADEHGNFEWARAGRGGAQPHQICSGVLARTSWGEGCTRYWLHGTTQMHSQTTQVMCRISRRYGKRPTRLSTPGRLTQYPAPERESSGISILELSSR